MNTHSRSALFLMELIVSILFFALSSVVCIQLFVLSHQKSEASVDRNYAVLVAQSVVESYKANGADINSLINSLSAEGDGNTYTAFADESGRFAGSNEVYKVEFTENIEGAMYTLDVEVTKGEESIFTVSSSHYVAE